MLDESKNRDSAMEDATVALTHRDIPELVKLLATELSSSASVHDPLEGSSRDSVQPTAHSYFVISRLNNACVGKVNLLLVAVDFVARALSFQHACCSLRSPAVLILPLASAN